MAGCEGQPTYYNEYDPDAAAWLRNLIADGLIAPGDVDERSIEDVKADDLRGYRQVHLFAGIGGWSLALRLAGVPDDYPVWTGSCPCPPFSSAGKKKWCPQCQGRTIPHPRKTGIFACIDCAHEWYADGRHLWPEMLRLIEGCQGTNAEPSKIFGEQVSGADGLIWLAGVRATLEALGYAAGGLDSCAAGIGSPNIRQRLWWLADAASSRQPGGNGTGWQDGQKAANGGWLVHTNGQRRDGVGLLLRARRSHQASVEVAGPGEAGWLGDPNQPRLPQRISDGRIQCEAMGAHQGEAVERGSNSGGLGHAHRRSGIQGNGSIEAGHRASNPWANATAIPCGDGKSRRIEPGSFPLAHGLPRSLGPLRAGRTKLAKLAAASLKAAKRNRIERLKGYGNAINPWVAAEFIAAALPCRQEAER